MGSDAAKEAAALWHVQFDRAGSTPRVASTSSMLVLITSSAALDPVRPGSDTSAAATTSVRLRGVEAHAPLASQRPGIRHGASR
jgi:hypothetical protein